MAVLLRQVCGCQVIDDDEGKWMISYCNYHGHKYPLGNEDGYKKSDDEFVKKWRNLSDMDFIQFWRRDLASQDARSCEGIELSVFYNALDRLEKK